MCLGYDDGYTLRMKTAISIPDPIFTEADKLASRLGLSRSELYVRAIERYLARHRYSRVTEALNEVYARRKAELDPVLTAIQYASLDSGDW